MPGHMRRLLAEVGIKPFLDDIVIATRPGGDHIADVRRVFEILTYKAGLR